MSEVTIRYHYKPYGLAAAQAVTWTGARDEAIARAATELEANPWGTDDALYACYPEELADQLGGEPILVPADSMAQLGAGLLDDHSLSELWDCWYPLISATLPGKPVEDILPRTLDEQLGAGMTDTHHLAVTCQGAADVATAAQVTRGWAFWLVKNEAGETCCPKLCHDGQFDSEIAASAFAADLNADSADIDDEGVNLGETHTVHRYKAARDPVAVSEPFSHDRGGALQLVRRFAREYAEGDEDAELLIQDLERARGADDPVPMLLRAIVELHRPTGS